MMKLLVVSSLTLLGLGVELAVGFTVCSTKQFLGGRSIFLHHQRHTSPLIAAELSPGDSASSTDATSTSTTTPDATNAVDYVEVSKKLDVAKQKASLMRLILSTSLGDKASDKAAEDVNSIIESLEGLNQGFKEDEVDGEWILCFTKNGAGSPSLQKALPGDRGFQNFDVKEKKFFNIVKLWGGKVKVLADLAYGVKPNTPNRLDATIVGARVKLGPIPVPVPLKGRVGYLDFTYQDKDIRVTRGDRGGLFLHMRPGSSFSVDAPDSVAE